MQPVNKSLPLRVIKDKSFLLGLQICSIILKYLF